MDHTTEKNQCMDCEDDTEGENIPLPGFRFHPTDEELVGFYLQSKVENKLLKMDIIKQIDIYKYEPSDLSKMRTVDGEEKEWYFFCKRGRKYPNSSRPNRVTGSGFWKATGIDKKIFFTSQGHRQDKNCIGLKKSLVYYRGSAGKGTKTEWMMHEFRLHPNKDTQNLRLDEPENLTICRIFKRNIAKTTTTTRKSPGAVKVSTTKTTTTTRKSPGAVKVSSPVYSSIDSTDIGYEDCIDLSATPTFQQQQLYANKNQSSRFQQEQNRNDGRQWSGGVCDIGLENPTGQSLEFDTEYDYSDNINWDEIGRYLQLSYENIT